MKRLEIELDEKTYEKIEQLAKTHHCKVSDLIKAMVEQLTQPEIMNDSSIGKWSNDAELVDEIMAEIVHNRI
ncbi:ribbon-helix-helix protein, CopG family [Crocosphaera chwakensis]|uniref:Uncharacterized protein n=1 Tax=Crocosphaera chwakensis CCY0110 TaxID=391612 RepID=A3IRT5_9CHRO|nr:ribbon-helix-helix protein, CopG family [Crocosphaera chwakensis]EAZ90786.1 hypothetical protein CY0110_30181 [Crocosphaera chwakensis CCY0110]